MQIIHQNNFIEFLTFLGKKYPKAVLSDEKITALKQLDNQQISQYLRLFYEKFELNAEAEENAFVASKNKPEVVQAPPITLPPITPSKSVETSPKPLNIPETTKTKPVVPSSKRNPFVTVAIVVVVVLAAAITYQYGKYQKLGSAYALSDELLIRTTAQREGEVLGSLNLFGKTTDKDGVEIPTKSEIKLYSNEKQGAFYKVIMSDTPFLSYLFNNNVGYVYSKFVTIDKDEQDLYRKVFEPIKNDYYELKHLEFAYRTIIVNAIANSETMRDLVVKESCDLQALTAKDKPLKIGQFQNKDRTLFYALVQLSDDNYYAIEANGFYNVQQIRPILVDDVPLGIQGKFMNKGKYFVWESCDKSIVAKNTGQPFDSFKVVE